jgi:hypothetical protein
MEENPENNYGTPDIEPTSSGDSETIKGFKPDV